MSPLLLAWWKAARWKLLGAAVCVALGFLLGRAGSGATPAELAGADSTRRAAHALVLAVHVRDSVRAAEDLARDAATAVAVAQIPPARARTDAVVLTVPDTATERQLVGTLGNERAMTDSALLEFVRDTVAMRRTILGVTGERDQAIALQQRTQVKLDEALQRRTEPPITLGATLGYGVMLSGGQVRTGPTAAGGLTVRIKISLPRWLGG